jgi:hypothetical protein
VPGGAACRPGTTSEFVASANDTAAARNAAHCSSVSGFFSISPWAVTSTPVASQSACADGITIDSIISAIEMSGMKPVLSGSAAELLTLTAAPSAAQPAARHTNLVLRLMGLPPRVVKKSLRLAGGPERERSITSN